jgi:hypothetical protein
MLGMLELLDQPQAFQRVEDPEHGSGTIPNPSGPGMPCTVLVSGEMAQDQRLDRAKLSPQRSSPNQVVPFQAAPTPLRLHAITQREPALVGRVRGTPLDNTGQKLDNGRPPAPVYRTGAATSARVLSASCSAAAAAPETR